MAKGNMSAFHIIATILVLLSLSMFVNSLFVNDGASITSFDNARQSVSLTLGNVLLHGESHGVSGTLYDMFCYDHNEYFGLRS